MPPATEPSPPLIVLSGPTGVGKSDLAIALALHAGGEVVNFDSVQLYRGFDIGSAKPRPADLARVPHHLIDVVGPGDEEWNAAEFSRRAALAIEDIASRGRAAILAGGTGFYVRALLSGLPELPPRDEPTRERLRRIAQSPRGAARLHRWLARVDPVSASRIAPADRHRVERALEVWHLRRVPISASPPPTAASSERFRAVKFALTLPRPALHERLDRRVQLMYEQGLVDETRRLLSQYPRTARPFSAIGYREAVRVADGELTEQEAVAETRRRTRAYAKRQMTWLRGEQNMHWIGMEEGAQPALESILAILGDDGWNR